MTFPAFSLMKLCVYTFPFFPGANDHFLMNWLLYQAEKQTGNERGTALKIECVTILSISNIPSVEKFILGAAPARDKKMVHSQNIFENLPTSATRMTSSPQTLERIDVLYLRHQITMVSLGEGNITDQQVEDLRERMRLLQQDRRANLENLEANKACNAEEVRLLREDNKELRTRLNKLQNMSGGGRGEVQVMANLQKDMLSMRAEHDSLKVVSDKNKSQLEKLKDDYRICELEARRPSQEDSPLARRIRTLENR